MLALIAAVVVAVSAGIALGWTVRVAVLSPISERIEVGGTLEVIRFVRPIKPRPPSLPEGAAAGCAPRPGRRPAWRSQAANAPESRPLPGDFNIPSMS
jgi:hypothetical protein